MTFGPIRLFCDDEEPCRPCPPEESFMEKVALVFLTAAAPIAVKVAVLKLWPELGEQVDDEDDEDPDPGE